MAGQNGMTQYQSKRGTGTVFWTFLEGDVAELPRPRTGKWLLLVQPASYGLRRVTPTREIRELQLQIHFPAQ